MALTRLLLRVTVPCIQTLNTGIRLFSSDNGGSVDAAVVPFMGESISDGTLAIFLKKPGDRVEADDQPIAQIETDKWFVSLRSILKAEGEEEEKKAVLAQVDEGNALLEKALIDCSEGKPFFNGDHIGYRVAFGCFLGWLRVTELAAGHYKLLDEAKTPSLSKWAERFCNDPAVKPVMPETARLVASAEEMGKSIYANYAAFIRSVNHTV